jgi:hypothetical protein
MCEEQENSTQLGLWALTAEQVVPGNLADRGVNKNGVFVKIAGPCNPAQWVPQKYCYKQFYNMCANKVKEGNFGRNGCQKFGIYNVNGW